MASTMRILRVLLALCVLFGAAAQVQAAVLRPNAVDRRVTAISTQQLVSQPASALVDPSRQAAAARFTRWRIPGFLAEVLLPIFVLAYFWRSGGAARTRDALRARLHSEFAVRWCFAALLTILANLAALIPSFYLYRIERVMGLLAERSYLWALDWLCGVAIAAVVVGFAAALVLWLADRTHQWYLYTVVGIVVVAAIVAFFNPFVFAPLTHRDEAISPVRLPSYYAAERTLGASLPIVVRDRSARSQTGDASLNGLWGSRRIVLSDTLIAGATSGETRFYVALEAARAAQGDPLRAVLFDAAIAILGIALAVFAADRLRFRRDDDEVSRLALVGALIGCAYLVVTPLYNVGARAMEGQAAVNAAAALGDRASAARAAVRAADQNMLAICPGTFARLYFTDAPPAAELVSAYNGSAPSCK
jgi:Zn-dependent protease with chaperone function